MSILLLLPRLGLYHIVDYEGKKYYATFCDKDLYKKNNINTIKIDSVRIPNICKKCISTMNLYFPVNDNNFKRFKNRRCKNIKDKYGHILRPKRYWIKLNKILKGINGRSS